MKTTGLTKEDLAGLSASKLKKRAQAGLKTTGLPGYPASPARCLDMSGSNQRPPSPKLPATPVSPWMASAIKEAAEEQKRLAQKFQAMKTAYLGQCYSIETLATRNCNREAAGLPATKDDVEAEESGMGRAKHFKTTLKGKLNDADEEEEEEMSSLVDAVDADEGNDDEEEEKEPLSYGEVFRTLHCLHHLHCIITKVGQVASLLFQQSIITIKVATSCNSILCLSPIRARISISLGGPKIGKKRYGTKNH